MPPRFFAPDVSDAGRVTLSADESHHLVHVLRLDVGATVRVFNGRGGEWEGRIASTSRRAVEIDLAGVAVPAAEPRVSLTLAVAVLKGDHMDAVVRDATMMGVQAILPLASARVVVPRRAWESGRALDRWRRVAVASAKQCGRAVVPIVHPVATFDDVMAQTVGETALIAVEPGHAHVRSDELVRPHKALALTGPEGGWTPEEVGSAVRAGVTPIVLGPRTLRAEAAPIVLLSSLWTRWGW